MTKLKRNIRSSQGLPEAMGFSMLPHSHCAIAITNRLTGSQFRLWHYLMMIDPFADQTRNGEKIYHPIPSPAEIAVAIGASQRTVEKDMKRLEELGLYARRTTQWEGYNTTAEAGKVAATKLKNKSVCPEPKQDLGGYLTADPVKQPDVALNSREQQPESCPDNDSSLSHTNQTYSDFIQTLSDRERENFEKFVRDSWRKKTAKNGEPGEEIISMERFLNRAEDLNNWWQRFLNSSAGRQAKKKAATGHDWYKDPRFNEWIWAAFERGYEWVHENEAEREVRKAFHDWAFAVNAFEGVCL